MIEDEEPAEVAAALLGVTESRVSQILRRKVARAMEAAHVRQEVGDLYRDDPEYSKLMVRWIAI